MLLVNMGEGKISLWNVPEKKEILNLQADPKSVRQIAFARDGKRFLTAGENNGIRVWDVVPAADKKGRTEDSTSLSDDLSHWTVMTTSGREHAIHREGKGGWSANNDVIRCDTVTYGWLRSNEQYGDFELSLEFKLPPRGNSGIYIRSPEQGHLSRLGMEVQVIDDDAAKVTEMNRTGAMQ